MENVFPGSGVDVSDQLQGCSVAETIADCLVVDEETANECER